jgi:hypothetical protein
MICNFWSIFIIENSSFILNQRVRINFSSNRPSLVNLCLHFINSWYFTPLSNSSIRILIQACTKTSICLISITSTANILWFAIIFILFSFAKAFITICWTSLVRQTSIKRNVSIFLYKRICTFHWSSVTRSSLFGSTIQQKLNWQINFLPLVTSLNFYTVCECRNRCMSPTGSTILRDMLI